MNKAQEWQVLLKELEDKKAMNKEYNELKPKLIKFFGDKHISTIKAEVFMGIFSKELKGFHDRIKKRHDL